MDKWKTKPYDLLPLVCLDFGESFFRKGNSYQVYSVILNLKRLALSQELIGLRHGRWVEKNILSYFLSKWMETRCVGKIFLCASVSKCKLYNKRSTEVSLDTRLFQLN